MINPAPPPLRNALRVFGAFFGTKLGRDADLGGCDYFATTEASMIAMSLLSNGDYEVLEEVLPTILEFDCVGSIVV